MYGHFVAMINFNNLIQIFANVIQLNGITYRIIHISFNDYCKWNRRIGLMVFDRSTTATS